MKPDEMRRAVARAIHEATKTERKTLAAMFPSASIQIDESFDEKPEPLKTWALREADAAILALVDWLSLCRSDAMIDAVAKAIPTATPNHLWANAAISAVAAQLRADLTDRSDAAPLPAPAPAET